MKLRKQIFQVIDMIHTLPTIPESNNQLTGIPNSLYLEIAMSLVRKSAYTLCSILEKRKEKKNEEETAKN